MKDLVKRAAGGISSAVERYRKLSRRERLVGWSGVAAVILLALLLASLGGDSGWKVVARGDGSGGESRLEALGPELDRERIVWREARAADGTRTLEVRAGSERAALDVVERGASSSMAALDASWLDESPGLFETPERFAQRVVEHNRRRVVQAIRLNPKIKDVAISVSLPPRASLVRRSDERGSAAVAIALKDGAAALTRGEVESIRDHVRCAFGLRLEDVAIDDVSGRQLVATRDDVGEKEESLRQRIAEEVLRAYRRTFRDGELSLSVLVTLSQERQSVEKKEMDREKSFALETETSIDRGSQQASGGVMSPSDKPVTLSETIKSTPYESYEKIRIEIPPGGVEGVSLIADFDVDAVLRAEEILRTGAATGSATLDRAAVVKGFVEREERWLQKFLGVFKNVSATVTVHAFDRSSPEEAIAAAAVVPTPAGPEPGAGSGERVGPGAWASVVALGIVLSGVLVLWVAIARRQAPRWPSYLRPDALRTGEERSGLPRFVPEDGLLDSVGHLSARVRERPDVAASILRVWLHQDGEELKEEALHA